MALGQEQLGLRIALAREDAGMSQADLAAAIGLKHPQSISNYERGLTEVPTRRLRRIAEATRKPMAFFLGSETNGHLPEGLAWQAEVLARIQAVEAHEEVNEGLLRDLLRIVRGEPDAREGQTGSEPQ